MPQYRIASRFFQARTGCRGSTRWFAAALLLLCALLAPTASFAASPAKPPAAPRAQGTTVERWVSGPTFGSNVMPDPDDEDETIPSTCTREIIPPDPDDEEDTEEYVYHSCASITYALSVSNPGDIIHVAGGFYDPGSGTALIPEIIYPEVFTINEDITIIGGYQFFFGAQISPPRYTALSSTIQGVVDIRGTADSLLPPSVTGEGPMEVRLETLTVTQGGIDIQSAAQYIFSILIREANKVQVTLEGVTVRNVQDGGGGIYMVGTGNKLVATETTIRNNTGSTGGGIYAGGGTLLELGAGSEVSNNSATNGGGIGASSALTLTISGGVTITGNTGNDDGGGIYAVNSFLDVGSGTIIASNTAGDGGGVFLNGGTNKISGATLSGNTATGRGGGIFAAFGAPLLENLQIQQNTSPAGGGLYALGLTGGSLTGSDVLSNTATNGGGYYLDGNSGFATTSVLVQGNEASTHGGGGFITGNAPTVTGNDFTNNQANNSGGGLYVISSAATLQSNTYTGNSANAGGGLYLESSNAAKVNSSTFNSNTANVGGGLYFANNNGTQFSGMDLTGNHANQQGGGLYSANNSNVAIGSPFAQANTSGNQGAGLYAINSTLTFTSSAFFDANIATGQGGAAYLGSGTLLTVEALTLQNNEASAGGGFYADNGRTVVTGSSSFLSNVANSGNGGVFYLKGSGSTISSIASLFAQSNEATNGGVFYTDGVNLTLGSANFTGNSTDGGDGAGAYFANSTVTFTSTATFLDNEAALNGGALYATASNVTFQSGGQFSGNKAQAGNGGAAYLTGSTSNTASFGTATFLENTASASGGGIYANAVAVTMGSATNFEDNLAQAGDGGGFYITGASLSLGGVTLRSNVAFVAGGGGYLTGGSLTVFADSLLDGNQAQTGGGGGLALLNATSVLVDDAILSNNVGATDGGALHVTNSPLTVQNGSSFTANSVLSGRGGAIYVSGSNTILTALTFSKNIAVNGGGALHITTGNLTLTGSTFSENNGGTLTGLGGGAYLKATQATLSGNSFSKNLAYSGAGLYLSETTLATLSTDQFTENASNSAGGGLVVNNSRAELSGLTLRANQAANEGGGMYALFSRVGMTNTLIVANKTTTVGNYAAGVYLGNSVVIATHSTIANNTHTQTQGSAHAFYVGTPTSPPSGAPTQSSLTLVNSIVSGQAVGVNLLAGNDATFNAVLWNNDHFNWTGDGTFTVSRSRRGDPRFVNAATNDYHLRRDSAAFDQGTSTTVSVDRDSVSRAQGLAPDLGAYEHRYSAGLYLTTSLSTPFVRNGDNLTLSLRVRNQSATTANNVILRATLPSQFPSPTISAGSCQGIFCEVNLGSLNPGADVTVNINVAVNGTASSNGLLTLLSSITLATSNFSTSDTAASASAFLYACFAEVNGTTYNTVQAAMNAASNGQTIRISGVCGDVHQNGGPSQLLTVSKNVTLQGGWNSTFTTLDPATFPTYLDSAAFGRVVYINGNFSPTFENLILRNGSASALGGGLAGKDAGGGVYINGGTPLFKNVDISNNQSPDLGAGVYLASPNVINFQGGFVRNNTAGERGGGLYINQSAPILTGVSIVGNTARGGGGVYLDSSPAQFIDNAAVGSAPTCRIETNTSTVMPNYVLGTGGGGLPVLWLAPGGGGGLVLDESAATLRGCAINSNTARVGGGAYIHNSAAFIENSLFTANRALQPNPLAILIGPGGVRDGDGGGLVLDNLDPAAITLRGLLLGNNDALRGSGMMTRLARAGTLTLPHFTINTNSGGNAVFALGESRLAFFNSIVAFNTGGAALFAQAGIGSETASITLDRTLFHPPTQTKTGSAGGGTVSSNVEFTGDPAFKNDGYHLKRISFAYGAGANTFTFADRDGNARPVGANVELGADEYATALTVRYVAAGGTGVSPCTDYRTPCGSLQTALDASSDGDFIKMAGNPPANPTYNGVRNDGGRIHHALISKSVTIEGGYLPRTDDNIVTDKLYTLNDWEDPHAVERPTVVDVNDQGRVFFINGNVAPTLSLLTLRRGNALTLADGPAGSTGGAGGAVYVNGASPIFKNVLIEDSRANFGSGFYLRNAGGSYTGVTVRENGFGVSGSRGGGFYIEGGQPTLQGMTIQANIAITGAGLYLDNSAATLIQNTIQSNGDVTTLDGGGLYVAAGTASLITNTITSNQAQHGGGLRLANSNATLRGNTLSSNTAGSTSPPSGQNDGLGGGLYIVGGAPILTANTLSNNKSVHPLLSYGGGVYVGQTAMTFSGNTLSGNQAHRGGGLYFAATQNIVVQNNTLTSNVADAPNESLRAAGGGVYLATATISMTTNTLSQNSALYGGGVYVAGTGQSKFTQNALNANVASKDGGGFYLDGSDAQLESNTLQDNRTTGGRGGGLYARNGQAALRGNTFNANQATLEGGGIFLSTDGTTLQGDSLQGNSAGDGGGIYIDGPTPGAAQAAPWIHETTLTANTASNHGGAFFIRASGAQITLNTLAENNAAVDGGGAYVQNSTLAAFSGNVIRDNVAGDQGGGLYITRQTFGTYLSNAIVDNSASQGGGIFVGGASPTFVHTTLARNGSALVVLEEDSNLTTVTLSNTIVAGHTLGVQGEAGATVGLHATLWDNNGVDFFGAGNVTSNTDYAGSASFGADGYHLLPNSFAANKGITGEVAVGNDVDNEGRFQGNGPELGADELTADCSIIVAGVPGTVYNNLQLALNAAPRDGELLLAGTCTGVETREGTPQLGYFFQNITLRGGYSLGSWEVSSPATQPTVLDASGDGRVIRIATGVRVTLANMTLINGDATGLGGGTNNADAGGNVYVNNGQLTLDNVDVINGRATIGGGLFLRAPIALVSDSDFRNNFANQHGGAIYLDIAPTSVQVRSSSFSNNRAIDGGGIYALAGTPILLGNDLRANQTNGGSGRGGAIYLAGSNATINRNRMENNRAGLGGGIYIAGGAPNLTNNMLIRNVGINNAGAIYSNNTPLHLRNNTFVANSTLLVGGSALFFDTPTASRILTLTNNILVDHSLAISVATGNQVTARANLWNNNTTRWVGDLTESNNNLQAAPAFVNSEIGNYRLLESSPAVDAGENVGVNDDIDGQARPARQGFDIGADEYLRPSLNASLTALPNPVASGADQTYVMQVVNNGDVDIVARIEIVLPSVLTPQSSTLWENVLIARGAIWKQTLEATVDADYTGPINAEMLVTSVQGATATASASSTAATISGEILEFSGESTPNPAEPGTEIELSLRIVNRGGIPIGVNVQTQLPAGLTTSGPLTFAPTIAGPDGIWSTRIKVNISPDVPTRTLNGDFNQLVTTFLIESNQGTSHTFEIVTELANPAIEVSRVPSPNPAIAGRPLIYKVTVANVGNVSLLTTINNTFPAQVALQEISQGQPVQTTLAPGQTYQQAITTTVEAGYAGPLVGGMEVTTNDEIDASVTDNLSSQRLSLIPTATAKGGDWFDPESWEPAVVPGPNAIVLIPDDVLLFSNRPISIAGLINRGTLELRTELGSSQALTLTNLLENYGEILGRDATSAGDAGLTLNLASAILYNEGTICAGDGAPDGGAGGDLIIVAGSTTNKGIFCAGNGANVNDPNADIPGGAGGQVLLSFDPGLFTNPGQVLAGNGGNSHPNANPPQPGGNGGDVTIIATAAARLNNSDIRAGAGGQGSDGASDGVVGDVVIGAPIINSEGTRFSDGTVLLLDQDNGAYNFAAIGPDLVGYSPDTGVAVFSIRIFNRGARQDIFVASPLATPSGWTVNNLPSTLSLRAFRSSLIFVVLTLPTQVAGAADEPFSIVISSQNDSGNQIVIPIKLVSLDNGFRIQLPQISR